jgi:YVTN family beta-propeller protein
MTQGDAMSGQRLALVMAVDHYQSPGLRELGPTGIDTTELVDVLSSPELGGFHVDTITDPSSHTAFVKIHDLLADRSASDVVLLYVIGQGLTDGDSQLYLAATDTVPDRLAGTAIGSAWMARIMARSRAGHVVMILDCRWSLPGGSGDLCDHFQPDEVDDGQSRAVICRLPRASSAGLAGAITAGIRSGDADRDRDGLITVDELYDYIHDESSARGWETGSPGQPYMARSPARRGRGATDRLGDPRALVRLAGVRTLAAAAAGTDLDRAADARRALSRAAEDQDRTVALAAIEALERTSLRLAGSLIDFGTVSPETPRLAADVVVQGPPLALASAVTTSGGGLRAWMDSNLLHVSWSPGAERLDGTVTLSGRAGDAKLTVIGEVRAGPPSAAAAAARRRALDDLGTLRNLPPARAYRAGAGGGGGGRRGSRRRLLLIFAGVLVLLVLTVVAVRFLVNRDADPAGGRGAGRIGGAPPRASGVAPIPPSVAIPTPVGTFRVDREPEGVAVSPDSRTVYVANQGTHVLSIIDAGTGSVASLTMPHPPHFVAPAHDGRRIYVSLYEQDDSGSGVAVVDTASRRIQRIIPTGPRPFAIGVAPDGRVWVPIHSAKRVEVYDADGTTKVATVQVRKNPHSVAFSPDGTFAYTPNHESNEVTMIVARSNRVEKTVGVGRSPHNLAVSPYGGQILVAEYDADTVELLDTTTLQRLRLIPVKDEPQSVAFAADGLHGYAVNEGSDCVSVIDIRTGRVTDTVAVGRSPRTIAVASNGRFAYVSNGESDTVTVLKVS